MGRDEETGFQVEQRNWDEESEECYEISLDLKGLIQGVAWQHGRARLGLRDGQP
jgi:hypothetical protein